MPRPGDKGEKTGRAPGKRPAVRHSCRVAPVPPRTVLLVEDHALTRGLLTSSLESRGFRVVAVESARRAIREFDAADPDVLLVDIELGDRPNGVGLATLLCAQAPYLGVVFLSNYPALDTVEGGLGPPPRSVFLQKSQIEGPAQVVAAIEAALDAGLEPQALGTLPHSHPLRALSAPQLGVLRLIAEGWSNAEIAERRGITVRSAERLVSRTFAALGVSEDEAVNPRVAATRMYVRVFGVPEPAPTRP